MKNGKMAVMANLDELSDAWRTLSAWLVPLNEDALFWWQATGPPLALMLLEAGYDIHTQYESLLFHYRFVVSQLGPRPSADGQLRSWKSYVTDDFTPLEFSWNWDNPASGLPPKVRCTMEAIGPKTGTQKDRFNQVATLKLVSQLQMAFPNTDWQWFHHFAKAFHDSGNGQGSIGNYEGLNNDPSSILLGFELRKGGVDIKAYFSPVKSIQTGCSRLDILTQGVESLERNESRQPESITFPAYHTLVNFLTTTPEGSTLGITGVGIDCVEASKSRLKVYVRSSHTSLNTIRTIMTLGDKQSSFQKEGAIQQLQELCKLVLGLTNDFSPNKQLPSKNGKCADIVYNFDIKNGDRTPEPQVYIPVQCYGQDDLSIAQGLGEFMKSQGRSAYVDRYINMVQKICCYRSLSSGCGLQTYISCGIKNGLLSITSYISPEMYHRGRWSK